MTGIDGCQAENDGDELTVKLKDIRKEVERREIVLKYSRLFSSCQPFCLGDEAESSLSRGLVALWQLFLW